MAIENRKPISSSLSKLLKKSLTTSELQAVAEKYNVHYNTIINIRDRRKKSPDIEILKYMIRISIQTQKKIIKDGELIIKLLELELEKLK